jgi:hypothetical protein
MMNTFKAQVGELAEVLEDLRQRLRQAARQEVARAIGEALRELARVSICGPARYAAGPSRSPNWEDDWQDPAEDGWRSPPDSFAQERWDEQPERTGLLLVPPALLAALGAARWVFARTRQIGPALVLGLVVALAAYAGGPTMKALVKTWTAASDLLTFPADHRR